MADATTLTIPDEIRQKFPELIELILGSESMNDEERQYWVNILPIMTPEQVENLRDILVSEKQQLAAIDEKYAAAEDGVNQQDMIRMTAEEREKKRREREQKEQQAEATDEEHAESLLSQIESL